MGVSKYDRSRGVYRSSRARSADIGRHETAARAAVCFRNSRRDVQPCIVTSPPDRRLGKLAARVYRGALEPAYPLGWARRHSHALRTIASKLENRGSQCNSCLIFSELAT